MISNANFCLKFFPFTFLSIFEKKLNMKIKAIILLLSLLCTSFFSAYSQVKTISLEDIWKTRKFSPQRITEIRSMNDGQHYTVLENNSIVMYEYKSGKKVKTIFDANSFKNANDAALVIQDYSFSSNEKKVLLTTQREPIFRHSFFAEYYVYDFESNKLNQISTNGKQRLAEFSPDGNKVAFVRNNNIYVVELENFTEQRITHDGEKNKIINGAPDWVYEEEFSFTKGFFWSPNSQNILYYRFDEQHIREYSIFFYHGEEYPEIYTYKYPKAGHLNSFVDVLVHDLTNNKKIKINVGEERDQYIPRIGWSNTSDLIWFQRLNRLQNHLEIITSNILNNENKLIYEEKNRFYIDITDNLTFINNNKSFIFTSEKSGFNHIYLYNLDGTLQNKITSGDFDIESIQHIDNKKNIIYFTSFEQGPQNKMLYSVRFDGKNKSLLFNRPGHYSASFSKNSDYFILTFSDANTPPQYYIYNSRLKMLKELQNNNTLLERSKEYGFVEREFFSFTTSENVKLNAWKMKPAKLEAGKKYPVLMYVYGGPGSQTVENTWGGINNVWFQMLVQQGFIVVSVDNRGTGGRGEEFKKSTYLQLGNLETIDQIESAKYLSTLEYVDSERIAIFGWSYGGYISALCITRGAEVFNTAIAVAPVTNWRFYDNIYTERFMRKPIENVEGYDHNAPIFYADMLKGNFLIVHGDADDNVHVQNTMEFVNALVAANKQFEMFIYPNRNHGIVGGNARLHLYTLMNNFLFKHLLK